MRHKPAFTLAYVHDVAGPPKRPTGPAYHPSSDRRGAGLTRSLRDRLAAIKSLIDAESSGPACLQ